MKRTGICALLLVVVAAACVPGFPADAPPPPGREIQVPEGDLWVTVWLPAGWIYFNRATTNVGDPPQVWRSGPTEAASNAWSCRRFPIATGPTIS